MFFQSNRGIQLLSIRGNTKATSSKKGGRAIEGEKMKKLLTGALAGLIIVSASVAGAQNVKKERSIGFDWNSFYEEALPQSITSRWNITQVEVIIPDRLTVSEENKFAPDADIVWHGDIRGDRKAQIANILKAAGKQGASKLKSGQNVHLVLQLEEFHGMTPLALRKLKYSGVYNITMVASVHDGPTNNPIIEPTVIYADLEAFTGARFAEAEAQGNTQKKRVTDHIAAVLAGWMSAGPDPRREILRRGR